MIANKTFLILLLTGISYTAYNAAAVFENFEISTTIDHEITLGNFRTSAADGNLTKTGDIDLGTIYLDPTTYAEASVQVLYDDEGSVISKYNVISVSPQKVGYFTANIPNPEECNGEDTCHFGELLVHIGGGYVDCLVKYTGSDNLFKVYGYEFYIDNFEETVFGQYSESFTITYNP
ncbi:MAG: hypothetical protein IJ689_03665 [Alphaproteobacteria bacterium]|nr:hypothetical protein [Alphaproteobacteria bacterium]